jgi:hypothetical protein
VRQRRETGFAKTEQGLKGPYRNHGRGPVGWLAFKSAPILIVRVSGLAPDLLPVTASFLLTRL